MTDNLPRARAMMCEPASVHSWRQDAIDAFAGLNDYHLRWLVTHLAMVGRDREWHALTPSDRSLATCRLLEILGSPEFSVAQAARHGAEVAVGDFIAAYEIVASTSSEDAHELSHAMAVAAILDSAGPDPKLLPDTLHALLGYRPGATMYAEVLELATEGDLIDRLVPDAATGAWLLGSFLHSVATMHRRAGGSENLDLARSTLVRAGQSADAVQIGDSRSERLLSSILYDLAYIDFLIGDVPAAQDGFHRSALAGHRAGDMTSYYMSRVLEVVVGLYAQDVTSDALAGLLTEALEHFTVASTTSSHAQRWVMNTQAHLFDLACLRGDADGAGAALRALEGDPWVTVFRGPGGTALWTARHRLLLRDFEQASVLYEALLRDELVDQSCSSREGSARDLLDYGAALAGAGHDERARQVWQRGLRCPDDAANWPWKPKIAELLAIAGVAQRVGVALPEHRRPA